jgi:hypothetical protein
MHIAALVTWLITALGGFYLLGTWIARGALRPGGSSRLPKPVIFGHFLLAAAGLVVWIVYLATTKEALAWTAFGLLVPVALLGLAMFARWLPAARNRTTAPVGAPGAAAPVEVAERHFPLPIVLGHGVFAVATVILVLITAVQNKS